jgi:hypothetical protein
MKFQNLVPFISVYGILLYVNDAPLVNHFIVYSCAREECICIGGVEKGENEAGRARP